MNAAQPSILPESFWQTMGRVRDTHECIRDRHAGDFDRNKCATCQPCLCQRTMQDYFRSMGLM